MAATNHTDNVGTIASDLSSPSSWNESKMVALLVGAIMNDFLMLKIIYLPSSGVVWKTSVTHVRDAFLLDSRTCRQRTSIALS